MDGPTGDVYRAAHFPRWCFTPTPTSPLFVFDAAPVAFAICNVSMRRLQPVRPPGRAETDG